ncbi:MAG: hypothetical protein PUC29_00155 [Clostridia bacterium]|nr:hypothetical protein [Clostridia bacterium]
MDMVFDIFAEVFFEVICEGFLYLCTLFIPSKKLSEKARKIVGIVLAIIASLLFLGLVVGIFMLIETKGTGILGWALVSAAVLYVFAGVALKIISHKRK